MTAVAAPPGGLEDGRIAMRVRVGVTGHRHLSDEERLSRAVRDRLQDVAAEFAASETTPVRFTILSALAEGADRLVVREARIALAPAEVELVAVLPLPPEDYARDFEEAASRDEFRAYLDGAASVVQAPDVPGATREEAYRRAGREVVDRSDVLIALWDGRPAHGVGGTAEIVDYARRCGVFVLTVPTVDGDGPPAEDAVEDRHGRAPERLRRARDAKRLLCTYNADDPALPRLEAEIAATPGWSPRIEDPGTQRLYDRVAGWARPHFVRAELRARRAQRYYHAVVDALFALAALAAAAVGWQISFHPERPRLALFETAALLLLSSAFVIGRRLRLHERWIGYRSLAEAFRAATFIAAIGAGDPALDSAPSAFRGEPWFQRAFSEAWAARPSVTPERCDVPALRALVVDAWVGDQIAYHRGAAARAERRHRRVTYMVDVLLLIAIVLSILHAFDLFENEPVAADFLEFFAIALPGVSAALTGHREHRQYRLNAERSRRTAERLRRVHGELQAAPDLATLRRRAGESQTIMVEENRDWFGVAELQELEVSL